MGDDRELLEKAARDGMIQRIGRLAIVEHLQWKTRNLDRDTLKKWRREASIERGELVSDAMFDEEDLAEYLALEMEAILSQRRLNAARAATRRAIVRALAPKDTQ